MLLQNTSKRLITINTGNNLKTKMNLRTGEDEVIKVDPKKSYQLMPAGPYVHVPEPFCSSKFVNSLIAEGAVQSKPDAVDEPESDDDDVVLNAMTKAELVALASTMELDLNMDMTKAEMIAAMEELQSGD